MINNTLAFTGHRQKELGGYNESNPTTQYIVTALDTLLPMYAAEGFNRFITGMALGFDTLAAEAVLRLKETHPEVVLIAAVPFIGQEGAWPDASQQRYHRILEQADEIVIVSEGEFSSRKMQLRNEWMVDHASFVLSCWNGEAKGGTYNCIKYAKEVAHQPYMTNISPVTQKIQSFEGRRYSFGSPQPEKKQRFREVKGDIIELMKTGQYEAFCITTNGVVKRDGRCVMGAGIAKTCRDMFPGLDLKLGQKIEKNGNVVQSIAKYKHGRILAFPVKHRWDQEADPELIVKSAKRLMAIIEHNNMDNVLLPRPGCGNGKLKWSDVKPLLEPILDERVIIATF